MSRMGIKKHWGYTISSPALLISSGYLTIQMFEELLPPVLNRMGGNTSVNHDIAAFSALFLGMPMAAVGITHSTLHVIDKRIGRPTHPGTIVCSYILGGIGILAGISLYKRLKREQKPLSQKQETLARKKLS